MGIAAGTRASLYPRNAWRGRGWLLAGGLILLALVWVAGTRGWGVFRPPLVRIAFNRFPPYLDEGPGGIPVGFAAEMLVEAARRAKIAIRWVKIDGSADEAFSATCTH